MQHDARLVRGAQRRRRATLGVRERLKVSGLQMLEVALLGVAALLVVFGATSNPCTPHQTTSEDCRTGECYVTGVTFSGCYGQPGATINFAYPIPVAEYGGWIRP